jgi:hypothetical protein
MAKVTFYQKLLLTTISPLVIAVYLMCTYTIAQRRPAVQEVTAVQHASVRSILAQRDRKLKALLAKHQLVFLAMTIVIYRSVSTAVFQTFACDDIPSASDSYLRDDYSISCKKNTTKHTLYKVYSGLMILVYPIGIPALYSYLLWRHRHKLNTGDAALDKLRARDPTLGSTRFLWSSYTAQSYYWEVVECFRRLMLTGFMVFILPNTAAQAAIACVFAVISLAAVMQFRPHSDALDYRAYLTGCAVIFASRFLALLLKVDVSKEEHYSQKVFSGVLILFNVGMILSAFVQIVIVGRSGFWLNRTNSVLGLRSVHGVDDNDDDCEQQQQQQHQHFDDVLDTSPTADTAVVTITSSDDTTSGSAHIEPRSTSSSSEAVAPSV